MYAVLEPYLIGAAILLLLGVVASKISDRLGVPVLLIFLVIGMLAGSDGPGGIYFDNPALAQYIGVVALVVILFSGGLDTHWAGIRSVLREGIVLATAGVALTAAVTSLFVRYILNLSWPVSILIGVIVSSTDAAAVFAILRSKGVRLKGNLTPLLELESGSNDPMAIFLTLSVLQWMTTPDLSFTDLALRFFAQMVVGGLVGFLVGKVGLWMINRLRLGYDGLYPVLTLGLILLSYAGANLLGGSGFLAVYLTGLVMAQKEFLHKHSLVRFYDGFAWLMQIIMFLALGLLVFPSRLPPIVLPALGIALILIFVARPLSVWLSLAPFRYKPREIGFVAWTGLRGAVPIILATYPYQAGLSAADQIFNVVFFVVLTSVVLQGTAVPWVARLLKVDEPAGALPALERNFSALPAGRIQLREIILPLGSPADGKAVFELGLPPEYLLVLIRRGEEFLIPTGATILREGDVVQALTTPEAYQQVVGILDSQA